MKQLSIEEVAAFCKRKGFVYPTSDIYGGISGFFDYGPLGVELHNNIKQSWWSFFVQQREDVVGMNGSIISHPKVWDASGHTSSFNDLLLACSNKDCKQKVRADHFIEDHLQVRGDGLTTAQINQLINENNLVCSSCKSPFEEVKDLNVMFHTSVGALGEGSKAFLRPETAQLIFTNFKLVAENARMKLPFGIAQIGKVFRNEISPRDFLFRVREFEQLELEYFVHPDKYDCPFLDEVKEVELLLYSADMQENDETPDTMNLLTAFKQKIIKTGWHVYWMGKLVQWFASLGVDVSKLRIRQHTTTEKSHYALDTWDLEYQFPFGWKELMGFANRTDYDLKAHMAASGKDLTMYDEEHKCKIVPHVVCEPSLGVGRAFLLFLLDAHHYDDGRKNIVLKLSPLLAPIKVAVFPLLKNKEELTKKAREVYELLRSDFVCVYDASGSVGKRYARQDDAGTPFCITIDFDSLDQNEVTIRDRDTAEQKRVSITSLSDILAKLLSGQVSFSNI